ncbi:MAG: hypothetical protein QM778_29780 [Myxococcales bacterium]
MANDKSLVEKSPSGDPLVMGVSVPLMMTKTKATEIASAWRECFVELFSVAKTKYMPEKSATNGAVAPTISA